MLCNCSCVIHTRLVVKWSCYQSFTICLHKTWRPISKAVLLEGGEEGGIGLWNNNFFQSQAVNWSSHWPDCFSFPENKSTLEEILSLNKNWCVLCPFRCRVYCYSAHGFGLINTNIVFWTQVRRLPSFFRGSSLMWNISPSRCSALCWFIVISSIQSLWKRCNSKFIKACKGGWCLWRRVPGAV